MQQTQNPAQQVRENLHEQKLNTYKRIRRVKAYLEPDEIEKAENAADNLRDQILVRLLYHLGCRISEALALKVDDVDFKQSNVTILHLKNRINLFCPGCGGRIAHIHEYCPGCGKKVSQVQKKEQEYRRQRILPVDHKTLHMLKEYIQRGGPITRDGKKLIFEINRHRGWQIIRNCARKAGLPKLVNPETGKRHNVSPHRLRDAFAVHAVKTDDSGDGLRLLQEHLGHASFNTTAKYRKVSGREQRDWYNKLWKKENDESAQP